MTSSEPVTNIRLSSVAPGKLTGNDAVREATAMDIAMKLHYITTVHFFSNDACEGMTNSTIKDSFFYLCTEFSNICGRFRRDPTGRPYMKCNDAGVRFVEAESARTLNEWLSPADFSSFSSLVYHLPLGPNLAFSPPCFIQITNMKCGGMALGLSFAHVLGDAFSLARILERLSPYLAGSREFVPPIEDVVTRRIPTGKELKTARSIQEVQLSERDHWKVEHSRKMKEIFLVLSCSQAEDLVAAVYGRRDSSFFHAICAVTWRCIARVRVREPEIVTICKRRTTTGRSVGNFTSIRTAKAEMTVTETPLNELAEVLAGNAVSENDAVTDVVEDNGGVNDYIVYGANLTFVNFEDAGFDLFTINGYSAENVYCGVRQVGELGTMWVQRWMANGDDDGKLVTIVVPEDEVTVLTSELSQHMSIDDWFSF